MRCHLPIIVEKEKSGVVVRDTGIHHIEKDYVLFDDSIEHYGFNESSDTRCVLIIDFKRPENIQSGISNIEASGELIKLCSFYNEINNLYKDL